MNYPHKSSLLFVIQRIATKISLSHLVTNLFSMSSFPYWKEFYLISSSKFSFHVAMISFFCRNLTCLQFLTIFFCWNLLTISSVLYRVYSKLLIIYSFVIKPLQTVSHLLPNIALEPGWLCVVEGLLSQNTCLAVRSLRFGANFYLKPQKLYVDWDIQALWPWKFGQSFQTILLYCPWH